MAEIKLICTGCGAQFSLPPGTIPAAGCQVACNRCGHVWLAHPPASEAPLDLGAFAPAPPSDRDRAAPLPAPSKRLSPQMLDLLRDEALREQQLRRAETPPDLPPPDPDPRANAMPDDSDISRSPAPGDEIDWPATTVTLPGGPARAITQPLARAPDPAPAPDSPGSPGRISAPARDATVIRHGQSGAALVTPAPLRRQALPVHDPAARHPVAPVPASPVPAGRIGYRVGFGLAVAAAVGVVAVYALAPMIPPEDSAAGSLLAGWRADLDQARLWLQGLIR